MLRLTGMYFKLRTRTEDRTSHVTLMVCSCQYRCQRWHHSLAQLLDTTVCRGQAPGRPWLRHPTVMTTQLCVHSSGPGDHDGTRSRLATPGQLLLRPVRTFAVMFLSICAATQQRHPLGPVGTIVRPNPCIPTICTSRKSGTNHTRCSEQPVQSPWALHASFAAPSACIAFHATRGQLLLAGASILPDEHTPVSAHQPQRARPIVCLR